MSGRARSGVLANAIASATSAASEPPSKKALSYLRVSSTAQADKDYDSEGYSLPAQRAACERKAVSLGAEVVEVYVERGESGTSTRRRAALTSMLARVGEGDIDYVIVHKVDRLARKRADDSIILEAIRSSGATLVSVSENIDETPSGMLLHGIMASIAEFYSMNLAAEVMKGTTEKARRGGTPHRAPIGYLNVREIVDGREIRTIAVDPERGPLVTCAFRLYATGDYSLSELSGILESRGLRNRPRRGQPLTPLGVNRLSSMLRSDYYLGIVRYAGKASQGRHSPLVDEATFQQVQEVLAAQRKSGERCWRHHNYLRGSVYCGECEGRLIYTRVKGQAGGTFEYFLCSGRQKRTCSQPYHRIEAVERAVEDEYARIQLSESRREQIRTAVRTYVATLDELAEPERQQVIENLARLARQEKKLLQAHYADNISDELFAEEQQRIRRERVAAEQRQVELQVDHGRTLERLDVALGLTDRIQAAYMMAAPQTRRLFNQAIFARIWIDRERVSDIELASPFAELLTGDLVDDMSAGRTAEVDQPESETSTALADRGGSNVQRMVRAEGLEPPRACAHRLLRPACLPIPPRPQIARDTTISPLFRPPVSVQRSPSAAIRRCYSQHSFPTKGDANEQHRRFTPDHDYARDAAAVGPAPAARARNRGAVRGHRYRARHQIAARPEGIGTVLVVTHGRDDHVPLVMSELLARGVPAVRFDTERYPADASLTFAASEARAGAQLRLGDEVVRSEDITAVLYRHRRRPQAPAVADPRAREMAESELLAALDGALLSLDAFWINHPHANRLARHKPLQLALAVREGFTVPETRITSDPQEVRDLFRAWNGQMVAKLAGGQIETTNGEEQYAIFTTLLDESAVGRDDAISACPAIYQRHLDKAFDLRVTVVGDQIFACRIESQDNADARIDWRAAGREAVEHKPHQLDPVAAKRCRALTRRLGLELAGLDLIVTPDGETVFLEINAAGQWAWVQQTTGMPIAAAIADRLVSGPQSRRAGAGPGTVRR